ncbi:MAG: hypothetical protein MJ209_00370 [archaeon]|nr:hypothetical protein [archaeon]
MATKAENTEIKNAVANAAQAEAQAEVHTEAQAEAQEEQATEVEGPEIFTVNTKIIGVESLPKEGEWKAVINIAAKLPGTYKGQEVETQTIYVLVRELFPAAPAVLLSDIKQPENIKYLKPFIIGAPISLEYFKTESGDSLQGKTYDHDVWSYHITKIERSKQEDMLPFQEKAIEKLF